MNKEDKELLLRDLSARLPYGVKVLCLRDSTRKWYSLERVNAGDSEVYLTTKTFGSYLNRYVAIETVKPYLFPMSSMTEEQKREYQYITERWMYDPSYSISDSIDWLNKNSFDYRGLIPQELAIDATGLNIY